MTSRQTAPTTPQPLDHRFTAPLEKDGTYATFVTVPGSAELLGTRRAVKVGGTIDGHPFTATLMPSGAGPHWLPVRAALCKLIGKDKAGEEVEFRLDQRFS
ncbi:DUF1905 domain-containing protein [Pseudonocardia aurantiaca]|uniref:DUF1905 domain-containing protein n=1 Tax=Pseudonocardia aurantiaca TaxID=75290 RepID=A0ABW4FRL3_9PSEU